MDTLIRLLTPAEIVGVLAHEIGHYKKRHLVKSIVSSAAESLLLFWVVSLILGSPTIAAAAGCAEPSFWINVQVFSMLLAPLGLVQGLVDNAVSRNHEREADEYSREHGCGPDEASALKKMAAQALSNLTPHPVVVKFEYSHPPLAFDHGTIFEAALERLRRDIHFQPVGFDLLDDAFTIPDLQRLYEAILGVAFDRRNFQRKILASGILEEAEPREESDDAPEEPSVSTDAVHHPRKGRPGTLFRLNRERYEAMKEEGGKQEF